jgi:hypothetical protein
MSGFGVSKLAFGNIMPLSNITMAFNTDKMPLPPSKCPRKSQ